MQPLLKIHAGAKLLKKNVRCGPFTSVTATGLSTASLSGALSTKHRYSFHLRATITGPGLHIRLKFRR